MAESACGSSMEDFPALPQRTVPGERRRLRVRRKRSPEEASFWSLPVAQQNLYKVDAWAELAKMPADGRCLFHCFRQARPDTTVQELQAITPCPPSEFGDERHLGLLAQFLDVQVTVWPVELLRPEQGLQEESALRFGAHNASTHLELVHWCRDMRGLHFDILK